MPEQIEVFRVAATYDVEVEKNSLNNASKLLDSFYKKYENKSLKVDTNDMSKAVKQGVSEMQKIYKKGLDQLSEYESKTSTQPPWWKAESGLEQQLKETRNKMKDFFNETKVLFSDGSIVSGLDNILTKSMENVSITAVDLGGRIEHLKKQIKGVVKEIDHADLTKFYDGSIDYSSGNMNKSQIEERIKLVSQLLSYQKEIESFNGELFSIDNSPTKNETNYLSYYIDNLKESHQLLEKYNLETTKQLERRRELINEARSDWQWDEDDHALAKKNVEDDISYAASIQSLERYIEDRKDVIQRLKDNEAELFSVDGIEAYVNAANTQIERFQGHIKELEILRNGNAQDTAFTPLGDLSSVVEGLSKVEAAIKDVINAFKPLTDALASEDSALSAMVKANVADLELLNTKVEEAFKNIETLSNKQFNMTNVISSGNSSQADLEQIRQFKKEARELYKQVEELYNEALTTGNKIKNTPGGIAEFLNFNSLMSDFDMTDLAKRIKSRSATSLGVVIDELNEWKKVLLQFNQLRNNVEEGSFNVSKYNSTSSKVNIGSKTTDKDEKSVVDSKAVDNDDILNKIRSLSEQVETELSAIRTKMVETFNFDTIDPKLDSVKTITDNIYQQFVELKSKIDALNLNFNIPVVATADAKSNTGSIDAAATAMDNEGKSAEDAVPKKNAFTEANKKAAESAEHTEKATKGAADGIAAEAKAIEQSTGAIVEANKGLDKVKDVYDADDNQISRVETTTTKRENAIETTSKRYIYPEGVKTLQAETIVRDFKKRADELNKEAAKIALAKKTVDKFLSQFDNKTAGHGKDITGYATLKNFDIKNLNDIEEAMKMMMALDTKYNELTKNFRKGTKSMNPFVNAFNSMDEMEKKVESIKLDYNNLSSPGKKLKEDFEGLPQLLQNLKDSLTPDANGTINIENIAKAYGNLNEAIKRVRTSISLQNKEDRIKSATSRQEEQRVKALYKLYEEQAESSAKIHKYRQQLNSGDLGKEEARLVAAQLQQEKAKQASIQQQIKTYGDLYNSIDKVSIIMNELHMIELKLNAEQEKKSNKAKEKELNELYKERGSAITNIIKLNNKLNTLKTDKARQRAREQLEEEKIRLALIDEEIDKYGDLANTSRLQKQDKRLADNNISAEISKQDKQDVEEVNKLLQRREQIYNNISKLKKQLASAGSEEERNAIQKELDNQNAINRALTQRLALYKDNAIQAKVTEQDNKFRDKDSWNKSQSEIKAAKDSNKNALKDQKQDYKDVLNLVEQLFEAQTALHKINSDPSSNLHTAVREEEIKKVKELSMLLKDVYGIDIKNMMDSLNKNDLLTQEQKNKLLEKERSYKQDILDITARAADKEAIMQQRMQQRQNRQNQNYGKTIYNRESRYYERIGADVGSIGDAAFNDDFLNKLNRYKDAYKELEQLRNKFNNDPNAVNDNALKNQFQQSALSVERLRKELTSALNEYRKIANIPDDAFIGSKIMDASELQNSKAAMIEFANSVTNGKFQFEGFNAAGTEMYGVMDKGNGVLQQVRVSLNGVTDEMVAYTAGTKQAVNSLSQFGNAIQKGIGQLAARYLSFYDMIRIFKQGAGYVKEIDLALTELRKVTNETESTYNSFLKTMANTGGQVGATVSNLTSSAADWARLGYSIEEAGKLAKNTAILMNVSEFDDVADATDTLISAMQAFKKEGIDAGTYSMQIIDEMNEVGNSYAISTSDLANSLTRSSAALAAANNTLEESIAMTTAANTIIQDPEAVGNALKVVSMRIRGVKTELEESGEEVDGVITNTAKLQDKIMALTNIDGNGGINILADDGNFKSTYEILLEISKVWNKIDDTAQAGLLEVIAGKVRGSTVAALLSNGDIMENAYKSASNASGSAQEELDKYLDSIQGKTEQFTNSVQTMWMNLISSDLIKNVVDFGTGIVKFLDTVPGKIAAIITAFSGFLKFKNISILGIGKDAGASLKTYQQALYKIQSLQKIGITGDAISAGSQSFSTTAINAYAQAVDGLTAKKQAAMLASAGLNKTQIIEAMQINKVNDAIIGETVAKMNLTNVSSGLQTVTVQEAFATQLSQEALENKTTAEFLSVSGTKMLNVELLKQAVNQNIITEEQAASIIQTYALTGANNALAGSFKTIGLAIKSAFLTNPFGFILTAIPMLITAFTWIKNAIPTTEKYVEKWKDVKTNLENVNQELDKTKSRIKELESQGALSFVDKQELEQLRQTNDELERRQRLLGGEEKKAAGAAQASVKKDYERDFIKKAIITDADMKLLQEAYDVTNAISQYMNTSDYNVYNSLTKGQQDVIQKFVPQLVNSTWSSLDSAAQEAVISTYNEFSQTVRNFDFISNDDQFVSGETYIDQAIQKIKEYKEELYNENGTIKNNLDDQFVIDVNANIADLESDLLTAASELYSYMDNYGGNVDDPFVKKLQGQIDKIDMTINPVEFYNKKFNEIFGLYSDQQMALYKLAEQGDLTAESLNSSDYTPLMNELSQLGLTAQDVSDHINNLSKNQLEQVTNPTFDVTQYTEAISAHSAAITEYQEALQKLGKGSFTMDDFMELIKKYPELAEGVDISSNAFYGLSRNLNRVIKSSTKSFIDDLKKLKKNLEASGKSTKYVDQLIEAVENMPDDALDDIIEKYHTLTDEISKAKVAQDRLIASMEENPNEGFETRGEAMNYMKEAMTRGEIGSESNLWNVAEQYGFTYNSAQSINENADALATFIAKREQWFAQDDDGNYTYTGIEEFIEDVEAAVEANEELASILKWNYDESTGIFNFDFDNENWDEIVKYLSESEELVGLTSDEFSDLLTQIGQYFGISWGDNKDAMDHLQEIADGAGDATEKIKEYAKYMQLYFGKGDVDLTNRPMVGSQAMQDAGWDNVEDGSYATVNSATYYKSDFQSVNAGEEDAAIVLTPILPDGSVISPEQLEKYAQDILNGEEIDIEGITLGVFDDKSELNEFEEYLHQAQELYQLLQDPLGLYSQNASIKTVMDSLEVLGIQYEILRGTLENPERINIQAPDLIEVLQNSGWTTADITAYIQTLTTTTDGSGIAVNGIVNMDATQVQEAINKMNEVPEEEHVVVEITTLGAEELSNAVSDADSLKSNYYSKVTIDTYENKYQKNHKWNAATGKYEVYANGTAHANGTAYSGGSWGAAKTETALVGELGPELV